MTRTTIQMGGGSPRSHSTAPATTGTDGGDGSYRAWYFEPPNARAIAEHHAKVRDAEAAKEAFERRNPYTYLGAADDPASHELSRLYKEVDRLRYEAAPAVEPSPCARHEEVVKALPSIAYIRAWGAQWAPLKKERVTAATARRAARAGGVRCPRCGGKL